MASGLADAIKALVQDKGISEELVKQTIEDFLFQFMHGKILWPKWKTLFLKFC
jgi:hypothetical protein